MSDRGMIPKRQYIEDRLQHHLHVLVDEIGARPTGSQGNQKAGAYLKQIFSDHGWQVENPLFDCLTWESSGAELICDGKSFAVQVNPYSPTSEGRCSLIVCNTLEDLEAGGNLRGRIVVLNGDLAREPYMPLHFPFFTDEAQQRILHQLVQAQPAAVIGIHSQPLFCDGDFPVPSVTLNPIDAARLLEYRNQMVTLTIHSRRIPSTGHNVIARSASPVLPKLIICAHYDTWFDTPGAVDNAAGVTVLLALAEQLKPEFSRVELVVFNGEDHYASPGEVQYLHLGLKDVSYVINIDGVGAQEHQCGVAYIGDNPALFAPIRALQQEYPSIVAMEPWYQGDHSIFIQMGIPALALTSTPFDDWLTRTHTTADTLDGLDIATIADVVSFVERIVSG